MAIITLPSVVKSQVNEPGSLGGSLRQNIEQQLPAPNPLPLPSSEKSLEEKNEPKADTLKIVLKGFKFQGVTLVSEEELQIALANWIGKSVTLEELQQLNEVIAEVYKKKGYLVQVTLPPQKIGEDGIILFSVMEAKFGGVNVDAQEDSRMSADILREFIFSENKIGEYINIDSIERAIYVLKEIPGIAVATEIEPGKNDGEANLKIRMENTPLLNGRIETNNYGSRSTGQSQGVGFISINNPYGLGEQITAYGLLTEASQYGQFGYSLPVAFTAWRLGLTASMMNYNTVDSFGGSGGRSNTLGASLTYPLMRSSQSNANLSLNYDQKSYLNLNTSLNSVTSSYVIKNISSTLTGNHYDSLWGGGINNASATITFGGLSFNQDNPSNYGVYTPGTFRKININLSRNQQIEEGKTFLNISFSAQLANENLDSSERFHLGGPSGVRAFPVAQGSGSEGALFTLELQEQLPNRLLGSIFVDAGRVKQYVHPYDNWQGLTNASNEYSLLGAGVGAKWIYDQWTLSGSMAWRLKSNPLYTYTGESVNNDKRHLSRYSPYVWLQLQYAL